MGKALLSKNQLVEYKRFLPGHSASEVIEMVRSKWRVNLTLRQVYELNYRNGIRSGRYEQCFGTAKPTLSPKFHCVHAEQYEVGRVRIRSMSSKTRPNRSPVVSVKVAKGKWALNHWRIWEAVNGPIPKGHKIIFLDGNTLNYSLTNLAMVSDAEALVMNDQHLFAKNKELTRSGIAVARVLAQTHKLKRRKVLQVTWKDIDYENVYPHMYQVNESGQIRRVLYFPPYEQKGPTLLSTRMTAGGQVSINLMTDTGKKKVVGVARLVAATFHCKEYERTAPVLGSRLIVVHRDGDVSNNHSDNLIWRSRSEKRIELLKEKHKHRERDSIILSLDENKQPVAFYHSLAEAARIAGTSAGNMDRAMMNGLMVDGYFWKSIPKG